MEKEIIDILRKIIWDYNIEVEDIYKCLKGEIDKAGFYTKNTLMIKVLERLYWYDIIKIISIDEIKAFLTEENIFKIYPRSLRMKYEFLRKLLSGETISDSGWSNKDNQLSKYAVLSDRWLYFKQRVL